MTPSQRSACIFVKAMADHIDTNEGRAASRETQQRVAKEVRARFFGQGNEMSDTKATNPKDIMATARLPLHLVPSTVEAFAALAYAEGAAKYGAYNWRETGVSASVYLSALRRHLAKWQNGEWADEKTGVPHLASIIADAGIILDAWLCGKLNDDRPPAAPMSELIDSMEPNVRALLEMFKDRNPRHCTIAPSASVSPPSDPGGPVPDWVPLSSLSG